MPGKRRIAGGCRDLLAVGLFVAALLPFVAVSPLAALDAARDAGIAGTDASRKDAPADQQFQPAELEGTDSKVAELAAHRLLQAISSRNAADDAARAAHLNYLLEKLQPAKLAQAAAQAPPRSLVASADILSAERIIDALATWTTSSGPPFVRASEVVQPLLGVGPDSLREAVLRAHKAFVLHELKSARRRELDAPSSSAASATLAALAARLVESPPPSEAFFRDASTVLWDTDGKALFEALVSVLVLHAGAPAGTPAGKMAALALEELESRVSLSFPSVDGWQKWWKEVKDLPLEKILADCQRRVREEYLANWRQVLRRLRETGDAERLFLAIQDTLDGVYGGELRVAAVSTLGDFAEWILDVPLAGGGPGGKEAGADPKDRLLAKGVQRLTAIFERGSLAMERPEVVRAALAALGKYHSYLERTPPLLAMVSAIVSERIHDLALEGGGKNREEMLEVMRIAGALRVTQAVGFVEGFLRERKPGAEEDLELTAAAVNALGRLLEKGVSSETAALLMAQFRAPRTGAEKLVRELRRACVTALQAGSESPEVRADLQAFLKEVLLGAPAGAAASPARGEKDLGIPAILGLGTLARQKDAGSFEALIDVLARQDLFEPQEVVAAIDSIAYVGGRSALAAFLRLLGGVKDRAVEEHLWKKVLSLVEAGGGAVLVAALDGIEARALEDDTTGILERVVGLCAAPQVQDLLSPEKVDPGSDARLDTLWKALMALGRAQDLLGKEEEMLGALTRLTELLQKSPSVKDRVPAGVAALAGFKVSLSLRSGLKTRLARADANDSLGVLKDIDGLLAAEPGVVGRWRNLQWVSRQLSAGPQTPALERIRSLWQTSLASEQGRAVWEGFPPKFRERFLARLEKG